MYVAIDLLDEAFLAVLTSEVLYRKMKSDVIFHVAALVLLSIAYFTDEYLSCAAGANLEDICPFVQGIYVDLAFLLEVLEEL